MSQETDWTALAEAVADGEPFFASVVNSVGAPDTDGVVDAFRVLADVADAFASARDTCGGFHRPAALNAGGSWSHLQIVGHLGRGRFGDVYRAWDPALDREVALKLTSAAESPEATTSAVVSEARLMARVRHPGVVTVHGAQRIGDTIGLWMELVDGRTLEVELAARGPFPAPEIASIGQELADALGAIHAAGLVHRDVKTSNVLRHSSGRVILGDFGTGQEITSDTALLEGLAGTPAYLAPEIFQRQPATAQSDVYSLGVLLFRLATGGFPHDARSLSALRAHHVRGHSTSTANARPELPAALASIIDRALDADPANRFSSASEMARALETYRSGAPSMRRRYVLFGAAAAALAGVALWGGWLVLRTPFEFRQRDWVLVGAFDNRTGNPLLDETVDYAVSAELGSSAVVNVVPRGRVEDTLALMRLPLDARLDERVAREVALRDGGVRAILAGRVDLSGKGYQFTTRLLDPASGAVVTVVRETASDEAGVLPAVGRLARAIRAQLGEVTQTLASTSTGEPPRVTTSSLKALDLYRRALPHRYPDAQPEIAEQLLREAVREDPDFAMAHAVLARAVWEQGVGSAGPRAEFRTAEIRRHLDAAEQAANLVTAEERYRIAAESAILRAPASSPEERAAHNSRALAALEALHRLRPDDAWAIHTLLRRLPPQSPQIAPLAEKLVALRPNSLEALSQAANRTAVAGEDDLSRMYMRRAQPLIDLPVAERGGESPRVTLLMMMSVEAWNRNDAAEALRLAEAVEGVARRTNARAASWFADGGSSSLFLALGQLDRAEEIASRGRRYGTSYLRIGAVVWTRRDPQHAREFLDRYAIDAKSPFANGFVDMFTLAGRLAEARAFVQKQRVSLGAFGRSISVNEAWIAWGEGDPRRVIALFEPLNTPPNLVFSNVLADAWTSLGNPAEAIRVLERAAAAIPRKLYGPAPWEAHHWLEQQDRLGRLYRQVGRTVDAERIDAQLRTLLAFADADHPILLRLRLTNRPIR